jgi:hypothetical protein
MLMTTKGVAPALGLIVAAIVLGTALLGQTQSTQAQTNGPTAAYSFSDPVDAGDGWLVAVETATFVPGASGGGQPAGSGVLTVALRLQNTGPQPRQFPTYRLHLLSSGGAVQQDVWCGPDRPTLELLPTIPPDGSGTGVACWTVNPADAAQVLLALDPPLGQSAEERLALALSPVVQAAAAPSPPATASAAPVGADPAPLAPRADVSAPVSSGAQCSTAYSLYADATGGYGMPSCAASSSGLSGVSGLVGVSGGSGAALRTEGVPPCRLYPSAAQGTTRMYGASAAPGTPLPAATPTTSSQGGLVGVTC